MGFEFKYGLKDMFSGAVDACKAKGLLPLANEKKPNGAAEKIDQSPSA